jgi:hypothetical protein
MLYQLSYRGIQIEEVLKAGLDPRKMPKNPENTPPSPPQSRGDRSVLGEELKRTQNTPRPVVLINITRPQEPDSTHPEVTSQTKEEAKASKDEWIRKAKHQKQKPVPSKGQQNAPVITQTTPGDSANQTGCAHFSGEATPFCPQISSCRSSAARGSKTTRKRITRPVYTVKDRLGPFPETVELSNEPGCTQWDGTGERVPEKVPEKEPEEEPEEETEEETEPEDMSQLDLLREVLRWRSLRKQKKSREPRDDPEGKQ